MNRMKYLTVCAETIKNFPARAAEWRPFFRKVFPYALCLYMGEVLYFGTKAVYVYGSARGIVLTGFLTLLVCVLICGVYLKYMIPSCIMALFFTFHGALAVSGIISGIRFLSIDIPTAVFVYRLILLPLDFAMVISVTSYNKRSRK